MRVVALGDADLAGFVLAGVQVVAVDSADEALSAWRTLDEDVGMVILSSRAADVIDRELDDRPDILTVVAPTVVTS